MTDTTPVILISGYLGAGKTTLVNNLLRNAEGTRLAILVNEFGDLPIDEDLIETKNEKLISISGGCICCSFGDDLAGALKDLTEIDPMPDCIVIESSGVALPNQIVANVTLLENLYFRGVLCVVDSSTLLSKIKNQYISISMYMYTIRYVNCIGQMYVWENRLCVFNYLLHVRVHVLVLARERQEGDGGSLVQAHR